MLMLLWFYWMCNEATVLLPLLWSLCGLPCLCYFQLLPSGQQICKCRFKAIVFFFNPSSSILAVWFAALYFPLLLQTKAQLVHSFTVQMGPPKYKHQNDWSVEPHLTSSPSVSVINLIEAVIVIVYLKLKIADCDNSHHQSNWESLLWNRTGATVKMWENFSTECSHCRTNQCLQYLQPEKPCITH